MLNFRGLYLVSIISRALRYADEQIVPPLSPFEKKSSSVTTLASVWWAINSISTVSYFVLKKRVIQKKKLRAIYFSHIPMDPLVSIIAITTAFESGLTTSFQVLNFKSSL